MDVIYTIVEFFVQGGIFMYPILLVFAVGVAIAIERYVTLTLLTKRNQGVWTQVQPLLAKRDFDKARELTAKDSSTVAQLLNMGLERQGAVRRREDVEIAMEECMMEIMPELEKRTGLRRPRGQRCDAARSARHRHGPDPGVHGRRQREPGREGRPARRGHRGRNEHDGVRPARRDSAARRARRTDDEGGADRRRPRDGVGQDVERDSVDGEAPVPGRGLRARAPVGGRRHA